LDETGGGSAVVEIEGIQLTVLIKEDCGALLQENVESNAYLWLQSGPVASIYHSGNSMRLAPAPSIKSSERSEVDFIGVIERIRGVYPDKSGLRIRAIVACGIDLPAQIVIGQRTHLAEGDTVKGSGTLWLCDQSSPSDFDD